VTDGAVSKTNPAVIGAMMAIAVAAPGVLSVIDTQRWEVAVARAAYGITFLWWNRPGVMFCGTTILILLCEVSLAAFGLSSGEWAFIPLMGAAFVLGLSGTQRTQLFGIASFALAVSAAIIVNLVAAAPGHSIG
jgi:hypothetical protein